MLLPTPPISSSPCPPLPAGPTVRQVQGHDAVVRLQQRGVHLRRADGRRRLASPPLPPACVAQARVGGCKRACRGARLHLAAYWEVCPLHTHMPLCHRGMPRSHLEVGGRARQGLHVDAPLSGVEAEGLQRALLRGQRAGGGRLSVPALRLLSESGRAVQRFLPRHNRLPCAKTLCRQLMLRRQQHAGCVPRSADKRRRRRTGARRGSSRRASAPHLAQPLRLVDELVAAVVARPRVALAVLVGHHCRGASGRRGAAGLRAGRGRLGVDRNRAQMIHNKGEGRGMPCRTTATCRTRNGAPQPATAAAAAHPRGALFCAHLSPPPPSRWR